MNTNLNGKTHNDKAIAEKKLTGNASSPEENKGSLSKEDFHSLILRDHVSAGSLFQLYDHSRKHFNMTTANHCAVILHKLLKSAVLLMPEYSTDVTSEEDKSTPREEWRGPGTVQLNVDYVSDLFYHIELIIDFLSKIESEVDMIDHVIMRNKIASLEKQLSR